LDKKLQAATEIVVGQNLFVENPVNLEKQPGYSQ